MKIILFANTDWYLYNFRLGFILALRDAGHDVLLVSPPGDYGQRLLDLGLRWQPIQMVRRSLNPLRELQLIFRLWRLLRLERPDLVHSFTIKCAVYGSIAARLASVPARVSAVAGMGYVFTSDAAKARLLRPFVRGLLRLSLGGRGALLVLQNSDDVALFERAGLVPASRIRLIRGSGVDCGKYIPSGAPDPVRSTLQVLLAARLLWDKGVDDYVRAARILKADGLDISFLMAGDSDPGNPAAVPEALVRDWHSEGIVQWLGHVADMPALLSSVDLVVLPSYREGLPKSLIEAAACALPLIATDVPGCREVITDGVDGLLVPVRDARALAAAIRALHDDPGRARSLGLAARQKAMAEFDQDIVIRKTIGVYEELMEMPESAALG